MVTIIKISNSVTGVVTRRKATEYLLGAPLTDYQWMCIQDGWKEFADDPLKYADTAVVDMVKDYVSNILYFPPPGTLGFSPTPQRQTCHL